MKLLLLALLIAITASITSAEDLKRIEPILGTQFGTIIEVEGRILDDTDTRLRAHLGKKLIEVDHISGRKIEKPLRIELSVFAFSNVNIPDRGTRVKLRGFETGGFTGIPKEAFNDIPRVATTGHHFKSVFQITKRLGPTAEPEAKKEPN